MILVLECAPNAPVRRAVVRSPLSAATLPSGAGADASLGEVKRVAVSVARHASGMAPAIQLTFPDTWDPCVASERSGLPLTRHSTLRLRAIHDPAALPC